MKQRPQRVYVMESEIGLVKLGISENPEARCRTIQGTTGIRLKLAHSGDGRIDAKAVEFAAHALLKEKRRTGEWFDVTAAEAIEAIKTAEETIEWNRNNRRARGRPPSGRKTIVQIGLDEDAYAALEKLSEGSGETISSMGRRLLMEAIEKGRKRR